MSSETIGRPPFGSAPSKLNQPSAKRRKRAMSRSATSSLTAAMWPPDAWFESDALPTTGLSPTPKLLTRLSPARLLMADPPTTESGVADHRKPCLVMAILIFRWLHHGYTKQLLCSVDG